MSTSVPNATLARAIRGALVSTLSLVTLPAAHAADAAGDAQVIEAVTVTAQRREERIQDVPLAISAIDGSKLLDSGLATSNDVARLVPNLSGQSSGGRRERPRWFIRGIGSNDPTATVESPIGIYHDDVLVSLNSVQFFPIFDLERVEVLRGPQGTLWGKNTTGGAINYISRRPDFAPDGYLNVGGGSFGSLAVQGAYGGGISDTIAARASVYHEQRDGTQDAESYAAFGNVRYQFTDRFALSAGARWTYEEKDIRIRTVRSTPAVFANTGEWWQPGSVSSPFSYDVDLSKGNDWREPTYDITPEFKLTGDVLIYARYAKGYRSGGFNGSIPILSPAQIAHPGRVRRIVSVPVAHPRDRSSPALKRIYESILQDLLEEEVTRD